MNVAKGTRTQPPDRSTPAGRLGRVRDAVEAWAKAADLDTPAGRLAVRIRDDADGIDCRLTAPSGEHSGAWFPDTLGAQDGMSLALTIERDMRRRREELEVDPS